MSPLSDAARSAAKTAATSFLCGVGGAVNAANDLEQKVSPFWKGGEGTKLRQRLGDALSGFCPYKREDPPTPTPSPYLGGQCAGVQYTVTAGITRYNGTPPGAQQPVTQPPSVISGGFRGPITPFVSGPSVGFRYRDSAGNQLTYILGSSASTGSPPDFYAPALTSFSAVRTDGQPDTCGNPPPVAPRAPTTPTPPLAPVNVTIAPNVTVPMTFSPNVGVVFVNARGEITVPVTVNATFTAGGITTNVNLDFDVNLEDPSGDPQPPATPRPPTPPPDRPKPEDCPPSAPCIQPEPEEPDPDPPPDDDPAKNPTLQVRACQLVCTVIPGDVRATEIGWQPDNPIYAPRLGSFRWVWMSPVGGATYSEDIDIKGKNQLLVVPSNPLKCVGGIFVPDRGVEGETFFFYGSYGDCSK